MRCGAKTRNGTPCQNYPVKGRQRCKLHGGNQKRGVNHHHFKNGLYSKYVGEQLKDVLDDLGDISTEDLIHPKQEIKLMQALIMKCKVLEKGLSDVHTLDTISKVIDRLISAKQRSQAIMLEQDRLVPAEDIQRFLEWMQELLIDRIGQEDALPVMNELKNFRLSD